MGVYLEGTFQVIKGLQYKVMRNWKPRTKASGVKQQLHTTVELECLKFS